MTCIFTSRFDHSVAAIRGAHIDTAPSSGPTRTTLIAAALLVAMSACGGGVDSTPAAADDTRTDTVPVTVAPVATDEPVATDPPIFIELTPELAAFTEAHGDLVGEWSTQLNAFGDEALEHLDDVSTAPAAASAAELSDQMIAAVGDGATDDALLTLHVFATGISTAIAYSADGDQDAALSVFLTLQAHADELSAILDRIDA